LEQIARDYGVSTFEVVRALPSEHTTIVPGERFEVIMPALTAWGEVLFIVHTSDIVLECAGAIPPGSFARGYYNFRRQSHRRPPQGRELCGYRLRQPPLHGPFVTLAAVLQRQRRGDVQGVRAPRQERNLLPEQVEHFDELRRRMAAMP
jgi:hypothetical protein